MLIPAFSFGLYACMDSDDVGENYRTFEGEMAATYVSQRENLKEFEKALRLANAYELLESYGNTPVSSRPTRPCSAWYADRGTDLDGMTEQEIREDGVITI